MRLRRSPRRWMSGIVLFAIVFAQLATSAYACPAMTPVDREVAPALAAMPCAGSMADAAVRGIDSDLAALCLEHCKAGAQTVDVGHAPTLAAPALFAVLVLSDPLDRPIPPSWAAHARDRDRAPPPAHSIVHCCWRI